MSSLDCMVAAMRTRTMLHAESGRAHFRGNPFCEGCNALWNPWLTERPQQLRCPEPINVPASNDAISALSSGEMVDLAADAIAFDLPPVGQPFAAQVSGTGQEPSRCMGRAPSTSGAVGYGRTILRFDGARGIQNSGTLQFGLLGIWGSDAESHLGRIKQRKFCHLERRFGRQRARLGMSSEVPPCRIGQFRASNVWFGGSLGALSNGMDRLGSDKRVQVAIHAIWGCAPGEIWAAGDDATNDAMGRIELDG